MPKNAIVTLQVKLRVPDELFEEMKDDPEFFEEVVRRQGFLIIRYYYDRDAAFVEWEDEPQFELQADDQGAIKAVPIEDA